MHVSGHWRKLAEPGRRALADGDRRACSGTTQPRHSGPTTRARGFLGQPTADQTLFGPYTANARRHTRPFGSLAV